MKKMFRVDAYSVVRTLIDNGKLDNQVAAFVLKELFLLSVFIDWKTQFRETRESRNRPIRRSLMSK